MCIIQDNLSDLHAHVNNKISHTFKSKLTSRGNVMFGENAMSRENFTSHLVEIIISTANFGILHTKHLVLPHV